MHRTKNGRAVVRLQGHGHLEPTPYLREWLPKLPPPRSRCRSLAVDLGCGSGRNSRYLIETGYLVRSFDLDADYPPAEPWKAGQGLPISNETVSLVLCQYVLMFLTDVEIACTLDSVNRITEPGGHVIVELQPGVTASRPVNLDRVFGYLVGAGRWNEAGSEWRVLHLVKDRCVLGKRSLIRPG